MKETRIVIKKRNGEVVVSKSFRLPLDLVEKLEKKSKKENLSEIFFVCKALKQLFLQE